MCIWKLLIYIYVCVCVCVWCMIINKRQTCIDGKLMLARGSTPESSNTTHFEQQNNPFLSFDLINAPSRVDHRYFDWKYYFHMYRYTDISMKYHDILNNAYMFYANYALNNLFHRSHIGSKGMGVHKWPNDRGPTILWRQNWEAHAMIQWSTLCHG